VVELALPLCTKKFLSSILGPQKGYFHWGFLISNKSYFKIVNCGLLYTNILDNESFREKCLIWVPCKVGVVLDWYEQVWNWRCSSGLSRLLKSQCVCKTMLCGPSYARYSTADRIHRFWSRLLIYAYRDQKMYLSDQPSIDCLIDYDGVRLCLRTAVTNRPTAHPPDDMWAWRAMVMMMMMLAGDNSWLVHQSSLYH
jgi:hypothetical protein